MPGIPRSAKLTFVLGSALSIELREAVIKLKVRTSLRVN